MVQLEAGTIVVAQTAPAGAVPTLETGKAVEVASLTAERR
jgi:hypothetical protein